PRSWPVEHAIAQHNAPLHFTNCRLKSLDTLNCDATWRRGPNVQRHALIGWPLTWSVGPGNALRDKMAYTGLLRGVNEIARPNLSYTRIRYRVPLAQVSQLVDDDIWLRLAYDSEKFLALKHIDDHGGCTYLLKKLTLLGDACRTSYGMTRCN